MSPRRWFSLAVLAGTASALTAAFGGLWLGGPTLRPVVILSAGAAAMLIAGIVAWGFARAASHAMTRAVATTLIRARNLIGGSAPTMTADVDPDDVLGLERALEADLRALLQRSREQAVERARTATVLATMSEGVLVTDRDGRVRVANEAVKEMLDVSEDMIGRHYVEFVRDPGVTLSLSQALTNSTDRTSELTPPRAPERRLLARVRPMPTPDAEGASGALLVLHDVTALRRADLVRRDFVANVSHELRTPLTAIRGYLEALRETDPTADEANQFLEVIARHTGRMERLVQDLLRLARLEAGYETAQLGPVEVGAVLESVVGDLRPFVEARGQRVTVRVVPPGLRAHADSEKLHDVVRNLVENASHHGPAGGRIVVQAECAPEVLTLTVTDDGPGLPAGDPQRVFERFYRGPAVGADVPGTGLGLSIVKHLVGVMGGRVDAANRPEGGAIFTVTIPVGPGPA